MDEVINDIHKHTVSTPYAEYPRHVHKAKGEYKVVSDDTAKAEALADGWSLDPVADVDEPAAAVEPEKPKKNGKPKPSDPAS